MIRSLALALVVASGWSFGDLALDRLRWNPRERTRVGIEKLEADRASEAVEALETAARLDADDPVLRFNAGSAHLLAESDGALAHLEMAAQAAPEELQSATQYNLANARVAAADLAGAIEAYEEALRRDPNHQNAKFNLELALRQQQEQEQEQKQEPQEDQSSKQDDGESRSDPGQEGQQEQEPADTPSEPEDSEQPQSSNEEGDDRANADGEERDQELPRFEEQPDMTAEQAAAILEAVENLEREQRREQARREMKKNSRKGKDW